VGLGLRNLAHCPVELNLMPESTLRWQSFNQKKPYFMATVFSLVLVVFATGWLLAKLAGVKEAEMTTLEDKIKPIQVRATRFAQENNKLERAKQEGQQIAAWLEDRFFWLDTFTELRQGLIRAEEKTKQKLGVDTGVWIEKLEMPTPPVTIGPDGNPLSGEAPPPVRSEEEGSAQPTMPASANEVAAIMLICRGTSLTSVSASANTDIAFAVMNELKSSSLFVPEETQFAGNIRDEGDTFTFGVVVKLKKPMKF
jgi:hypothetical protein